MLRLTVRVVIALALVLVGWVAAKAQPTTPDFEVVVDSPAGETTVTCKRGCNLAWIERGVNPNATPMRTFTFKCSGGPPEGRCSSATVGGWITH